jgi:hypothetical protein
MTRFFLLDALRGWAGVGKCFDLNEAGSIDWLGVESLVVLMPSAQFSNVLLCKDFAFVMGLCK